MPPKSLKTKKSVSKRNLLSAISKFDISNHELRQVPGGAIEGYQERIETGIEWSLTEQTARHHKQMCMKTDIPIRSFSEAYKLKLQKSILSGLLNESSKLTLDEYLELTVATIWEKENLASEMEKQCFHSNNAVVDDIESLLRKVVKHGNRKKLKSVLKKVFVLRINHEKVTYMDKSLWDLKNLEQLILCENYIKDIDGEYLPKTLRMLELYANGVKNIPANFKALPCNLYYLGLARNLLNDDSAPGFWHLPTNLSVLDLGDNDIYDLTPVLKALATLRSLTSLTLAGNPCSVSSGYALATLKELPYLVWLDNRQIMEVDRISSIINTKKNQSSSFSQTLVRPQELRSNYFIFRILRVMSVPPPPKLDKGFVGTYHVEVEIPLLDSKRRSFLLFRNNESLIEISPSPEDDCQEAEPLYFNIDINTCKSTHKMRTDMRFCGSEEELQQLEVYKTLKRKSSKEILNFEVFKSNKVPWSNIMYFHDPSITMFCPDLTALRDTFRSVITVRLVYSLTQTLKQGKNKNVGTEYSVVLATIRCSLKRPDWSQKMQYFHWDASMDTNDAVHCGDGDLDILQYVMPQSRVFRDKKKDKGDSEIIVKQPIPPDLTCHFSFGIETLLNKI